MLRGIMILVAIMITGGVYAQTYDTPCDAEASPVGGWSGSNQTQTLSGDLTGATSFTTNDAGGVQDFGCTGAENAVFYKLDLNNTAKGLKITHNSGTANNISIALISLTSTECGGGDDYGEAVYLDAASNELLNCDLIDSVTAFFDLCALSTGDYSNLYLWISSPQADEGTFTIDVTQWVEATNNQCSNAIVIPIETGRGEACGEASNEGACSDMINLGGRPNDPNDRVCFRDFPEDPLNGGVWFEITTDADAYFLDYTIEHSSGEEVNLTIYEASPDCNTLLPTYCEVDADRDGNIFDVENVPISPNTTYYVYISTKKKNQGVFSLCLESKDKPPCNVAPQYYNQSVPVCDVFTLDNYCLTLQDMPPYRPHPWYGCGRKTIDNPSWVNFVAGSFITRLEIIVNRCQNRQGAEIGVYELPCDIPYGRFFPGQLPDDIDEVTRCANVLNCVVDDTIEIMIYTNPGEVYGLLFDGCEGDICDIEINVLEGDDAPAPDYSTLEAPSFEPEDYGFDGDTICAGAEDIQFSIENDAEGACRYIWYLNGFQLGFEDYSKSRTIDFPSAGTYDICVAASNFCDTTELRCTQVYVQDLPPFTTVDTICEGDPYQWIGPYGNVIQTSPRFDSDDPGDYVYTGTTANSFGCPREGRLELYVRPENDEWPTFIDTIICYNDLPFNILGTQISGPVDNSVISLINPENGCDTFFNINLQVLGGFFFINPSCDELGNVIFRFEEVQGNYTDWFTQFSIFEDPNNAYDYGVEWISVEKDSVVGDTLPLKLSQQEIEDLAENRAMNLRLRLIILYEGDTLCDQISPPVLFNLDDNFPRVDKILGDTAYCPGQKELNLYADVHHPLEPAPFGEFPDSIGFYDWYPPDGFFRDTARESAIDTIILDAPANPTDNTICLKVTTERCKFTDSLCQELVIEEPIQPILEANNETCDTFWSFQPDTAIEGAWSVIEFPSSGNRATFADSLDPFTTVSVSNYGSYTFLWREGAKSCAKYDSVTIDFLRSEVRGIVNDSCLDLDFVAEVTLIDGRGGYSIHPSSTITGTLQDSVFISDTIPIDKGPGGNFGDILYLVVEDSLGCVSEPIAIRLVCDCETESGSMSNEALELCMGDEAISDYLGGFVNDGTDTLVFILHEGDLAELEGIIDTSITGNFPFNDEIVPGRSYYISAVAGNRSGQWVDLNDPCLQVAPGQEVIWYAYPEVDAGQADTVCGLSYSLNADVTLGNFVWRALSGPGNVNIGDPNNPLSSVNVSEPGIYVFRAIQQNVNCSDTSEVSITFAGQTNYDIDYECDSAATSYIATVTINGGGSEYTLVEGDGSLVNNTFVSNPISKGNTTRLIIQTNLNCGPDTLLLQSDCDCLTEVGTFNTDTILLQCEDNCIDAAGLYDPANENLDGNDLGTYILHSGSSVSIEAPVFFDSQGNFCFEDIRGTVAAGDTLYIGYIIGNDDGNGGVDLTDSCLQFTEGAVVIFAPRPVANAGNDINTCELSTALNASASSGQGNWSQLSGPSNNVTFGDANAPNTSVTVDEYGTYEFIWQISYLGCIDTDTVNIRFLSIPEVSDLDITCDATGDTYTVTFSIQGGDMNTYEVIGSPGSLNGNVFTSDPITSDSSYQFIIFDGNNCDSILLQDSHDCDCITNAGMLDGDDLFLCESEAVNSILYDGSGENRDANDSLIFVLYDGNGNIVKTSSSPDFTFDDSMDLGAVYFVRALLGSVIGGEFQFDESCTDETNPISVTWFPDPMASIESSEDSITCETNSVFISGENSTGENLIYNWTTSTGSIVPGTENSVVAEVTAAGVYRLRVLDTLSMCSDEAEIEIFSSNDIPLASILSPDTLNCLQDTIILDGSNSSQGSQFSYEWSTSNGNIISTTNGLTITVDQTGTYTLRVVNDDNGCENSASIQVVESLEQPEVMIETPEILTCDRSTVTLNAQGSSSGSGIIYSWRTDEGNIISDPSSLNIEVSEAGTYILVVTNTNNGCSDSADVSVERDTAGLSEIEIEAMDPICYNDRNGNIRVEALDGNSPIVYRLNDSIENDQGIFTDLAAGNYRIEVEDANGCTIIRNITLTNPDRIEVDLVGIIEIEEGDSAIIQAEIPAGLSYDTLIWDTDTVPFECRNPDCSIIEISPGRSLTVSARLIGLLGCSDEDSVLVIVQMIEPTESVYIPNVFTPNGDGVNDVFLPEAGLNVVSIHFMQIYDRWGTLMFESRNFEPGDIEFGWDGTYKGTELAPAVFTYQIEVEFRSGERKMVTGTVSLLK